MQEVPDGPKVTACPKDLTFESCSSAPKSGTGNVLCCNAALKTGETESCGPGSALDPNNTYQCVSSATECSKLKGKLFTPVQGQSNCSLDLVKGYGFKPCCQIPIPQAKVGSTAAKKAAPPSSYNLSNPLGTTSIPVIIGKIIKMFLGIVGALALLVFVYGGVAWMTARGDTNQVKHAQQALQGAILGLLIISGSYLFADSFIKALTESSMANPELAGTAAGANEPTQATTEQTTLEQQQAEAAAAAKAQAQSGNKQTCIADANYARACRGNTTNLGTQTECAAFCQMQAQNAGIKKENYSAHPCPTASQSGCPTDQVCCSWKK